MPKAIKRQEIQNYFVQNGIVYKSIAANVDQDGNVVGYSYEAHVTPPSYFQWLVDATVHGSLIGIVIFFVFCVLGVFLR